MLSYVELLSVACLLMLSTVQAGASPAQHAYAIWRPGCLSFNVPQELHVQRQNCGDCIPTGTGLFIVFNAVLVFSVFKCSVLDLLSVSLVHSVALYRKVAGRENTALTTSMSSCSQHVCLHNVWICVYHIYIYIYTYIYICDILPSDFSERRDVVWEACRALIEGGMSI